MITCLERTPLHRGLARVAEAAEVSVMTVSRVMRGSPRVSPETRARVLRAAQSLNYRPDPVASRLMAAVRKGKGQRIGAALAFVRDRRSRSVASDRTHRYVDERDIRQRAEVQGYAVDEFVLGRDGLTASRLQTILAARGIEGIVFSLEVSRGLFEGFDFSPFSCSTLGYGLRVPALHRASTNMMQGLLNAFTLLASRGYRRIGLAVTPWVNERADHAYSGAMLHYQTIIPKARRVPPLLFASNDLSAHRKEFRAWARLHRPDVLISFETEVPDWVRADLCLRIPEDVGFVVHDWTPRAQGFAGISHNRPHVATAAVDLVTTQLFHSEQGIPTVAREVLIPASWVEGGSLLA